MDMESQDILARALNRKAAGVWYAVAAFSAWGLLPLYWKLLIDIPAIEICAHRILWSLIFVAIIVSFQGRWSGIKKAVDNPEDAHCRFTKRNNDRGQLVFIYLGGKPRSYRGVKYGVLYKPASKCCFRNVNPT